MPLSNLSSLQRLKSLIAISIIAIIGSGCTMDAVKIGHREDDFKKYKAGWIQDDTLTLLYDVQVRWKYPETMATRWSTFPLNQLGWTSLDGDDQPKYQLLEIRRSKPPVPVGQTIPFYWYSSDQDLVNGIYGAVNSEKIPGEISAHINDSWHGHIVLARSNPLHPGTPEISTLDVPMDDEFDEPWALPARVIAVPFAVLADAVMSPYYLYMLRGFRIPD